jgi:hypothetical protein
MGFDGISRCTRHNHLMVFAVLMVKWANFAKPRNDIVVWRAVAAELLRSNGHLRAIHHVATARQRPLNPGVSDNFGKARLVFKRSYGSLNLAGMCDQVRKPKAGPTLGNWTISSNHG